MARARNRSWGNATIEFTLVGIPLVFVLISTIEMARGMWIYHTLAYAVKEGTRYAVGRGQNNVPSSHATYQRVCQAILSAGTGLINDDFSVTFQSLTDSKSFANGNDCLADTDQWPPGAIKSKIDDQPGQAISITGYYPFVSTISMFWPGAGQGMQFNQLTCKGSGTLCLPAASQDVMQF